MNEQRDPASKIEVACFDELASSAGLPVFDEAREVMKPRDVVVFCGDADQVRAGLILALDAMEARDDLLMTCNKKRELK